MLSQAEVPECPGFPPLIDCSSLSWQSASVVPSAASKQASKSEGGAKAKDSKEDGGREWETKFLGLLYSLCANSTR